MSSPLGREALRRAKLQVPYDQEVVFQPHLADHRQLVLELIHHPGSELRISCPHSLNDSSAGSPGALHRELRQPVGGQVQVELASLGDDGRAAKGGQVGEQLLHLLG
jgi:hypothetical protein